MSDKLLVMKSDEGAPRVMVGDFVNKVFGKKEGDIWSVGAFSAREVAADFVVVRDPAEAEAFAKEARKALTDK